MLVCRQRGSFGSLFRVRTPPKHFLILVHNQPYTAIRDLSDYFFVDAGMKELDTLALERREMSIVPQWTQVGTPQTVLLLPHLDISLTAILVPTPLNDSLCLATHLTTNR